MFTNSTTNYNLPQYVAGDKPTILSDFNGAMSNIDTALKTDETKADDAKTTATTAKNAADAAAAASATNAQAIVSIQTDVNNNKNDIITLQDDTSNLQSDMTTAQANITALQNIQADYSNIHATTANTSHNASITFNNFNKNISMDITASSSLPSTIPFGGAQLDTFSISNFPSYIEFAYFRGEIKYSDGTISTARLTAYIHTSTKSGTIEIEDVGVNGQENETKTPTLIKGMEMPGVIVFQDPT